MRELDTDRGMGRVSGNPEDKIMLDFADPDMEEMFAFKFPGGYTGRELDDQPMNCCVVCTLVPLKVVDYCTDYYIHQTAKIPTTGEMEYKRKSFNQWMKEQK